jgi:hypothetical protein
MKREVSKENFEYGIYEVYYNDDGTVSGYTLDSLVPVTESVEGLQFEMEKMKKAFDLETLDYK